MFRRSPKNNVYSALDVAPDDDSIVEKTLPNTEIKPKTFKEVMKDVIVYVEVRSATANRTMGVRNAIEKFGIKVNDKFLRYER